jgi:glycosyltransferase involved in cell wall biosynthesis
MRILNIMQCANLGGMERASFRLMRALQSRGHELRLISLNPIKALGPRLKDAQIPAFGLDYAHCGKIDFFWDFRRVIGKERADALIMTGHNLAASLALGNVCRGRRMLAIHYHHEGVMPAWQWRLIYCAARAQFQSISFPSDYVRREAEAIYPPIQSISETVRNPLEVPPPFDPLVREAFRGKIGVPIGAPLVGNAGWLIRRKRFDVFLHAAAELLQRRQDAHFVIAGEGEESGKLRELAISLNIEKRVSWCGWLNELTPFYAGIDVLLFNSDWDAFPTTPIEAMSHAVPIVASASHGGLGEILDSDCGWLIDRHSPRELSDAIIEALSPEGRFRAERARRRVAEISDPAKIAETVERKLCGAVHAGSS